MASWVRLYQPFWAIVAVYFYVLHNFIYWFAESSLLRGLFSTCGDRGYSLGTVLGLLNIVASLVVAHGLGCCGM